jgi:hypothetical protein
MTMPSYVSAAIKGRSTKIVPHLRNSIASMTHHVEGDSRIIIPVVVTSRCRRMSFFQSLEYDRLALRRTVAGYSKYESTVKEFTNIMPNLGETFVTRNGIQRSLVLFQ